ncbi:2-deoxy-scyllo-inosose synthase [Nocardia sp. NPDC004722]
MSSNSLSRNGSGVHDGSGLRSRPIVIGDETFPYYSGRGCVAEIAAAIADLTPDKLVFVTDDEVLARYGRDLDTLAGSIPALILSRPAGEAMKTLDCLSSHLEAALRAGITRRSVVVSFGGGVPGNLAGLMASLLFRGVRLVHVPTTTIAAMDSVLSLKQAINSGVGKNHLGTYYTPEAVFTDVDFFATLPDRELRSGLCEMAKNCLAIQPSALPGLRAVIAEGALSAPDSLLWLLDASIVAKSAVTARDTFERRAGLALEYGHTVGHAIEICDHRARGAAGLPHGTAIALGMLVAAHIAHARGWLSDDEVGVHYEIVTGLGVEPALPPSVCIDDVLAVVADDNKRGYLPPQADTVPFVLLRALGRPESTGELPLTPVHVREIRAALDVIAQPSASAPIVVG